MITYKLKKGAFIVGDPGVLIRKNEDGNKLTDQLFSLYQVDRNHFHELELSGIKVWMMRTAEGDGYYQTVGTDSGTIMVICYDDYHEDKRLNLNLHHPGTLTIELEENDTVSMERFNLYFSNGVKIITQSDDM